MIGDYVAVIGLGYIGLPLAACLAASGSRVVGVDTDPAVRAAVLAREPVGFEPGLVELLRSLPEGSLEMSDRLPDHPPRAIVVCVGTAIDPASKEPDLGHLAAAVAQAAACAGDDTLVVIRSTVPVGTCRGLVLPQLRRRLAAPLLAFCPERTIQGRAVAEIQSLPQIIGGLDKYSSERARLLFKSVSADQVMVSSLEAAEMIKLICNAHTDLIYGFGNEVALIAETFGLDAYELVRGANLRYPRPDLSKPGFVGGSCLVKDPYLLAHASRQAGYRPVLVETARSVNESIPHHAVERVVAALAGRGTALAEAKVMVAGIAYKGSPVTDDVRGAASTEVARELAGRVGALVGHDPVVPPERIAPLGFQPQSMAEGLQDADVLMLMTDHPCYRALDAGDILRRMRPRPVVFDMWGVQYEQLNELDTVTYLGLGRG
jgi:UDP-N-acetyl-D-mannosaminuronic acid dehydrogenase